MPGSGFRFKAYAPFLERIVIAHRKITPATDGNQIVDARRAPL